MKKILMLMSLCIVYGFVHAQTTLSLDNIRDSILQNHPSLKMVKTNYKAAEAAAAGAYSWMPPEVGAGFFQAPYNVSRWKGTSAMPGMGMFMLSAEQMFPNKKAQDAQYEFLKSNGNIVLEKEQGILSELLSQARIAYYNLIVLQKKTALVSQNEKLVEFMIQSAEIRYKNNLGNINSYYKLKAALAKLKTVDAITEAKKNQQQYVINHILLRDENTAVVVDTAFHWYSFGSLFGNDVQLQHTSEYQALEKTIAANKLERKAEVASLKPQFGIKYEHMVGFGHQPQMFSLMAMMKLPLANWSARMSKAKIQSLAYQNESLQSEQLAYVSEKKGKASALFAELKGIREELEMYDKEVLPALLKNFQTIQISYEQNKAEIFELFDAWQSLLDAKMDYLDSLQSGMDAQAELLGIFEVTADGQ